MKTTLKVLNLRDEDVQDRVQREFQSRYNMERSSLERWTDIVKRSDLRLEMAG